MPLCTPSYDLDGNSLNDCSHIYTWQADGAVATVDTVALTYDALGRVVEQARGAAYTQIVYSPGGGKLALMNGSTLQKGFVPLPGGGTAVYNASGIAYYRHSDWLGSSRLATTATAPTSVYADAEYAPYGESYGTSGTLDLSFTGQNQDTVSSANGGLYDFAFREYSPVQGRWISPDPAGMGAASAGAPQTWNRYAYVGDGPLTGVDPLGLQRGGDCVGCKDDDFDNPNATTYYLDGIQVSGAVAQSVLGMGAAVNCGNLCDPVHIQSAGWAFPSFAADNSLNWSFSFPTVWAGLQYTNAAMAEALGLPGDSTANSAPANEQMSIQIAYTPEVTCNNDRAPGAWIIPDSPTPGHQVPRYEQGGSNGTSYPASIVIRNFTFSSAVKSVTGWIDTTGGITASRPLWSVSPYWVLRFDFWAGSAGTMTANVTIDYKKGNGKAVTLKSEKMGVTCRKR